MDLSSFIDGALAGLVAGAALGGEALHLIRKYIAWRGSRLSPLHARREYFLEEAKWLDERARKLDAFYQKVGKLPMGKTGEVDRYEAAILASELDRHDWHDARSSYNPDTLCKWARFRAEECRMNAASAILWADELAYKIYDLQ